MSPVEKEVISAARRLWAKQPARPRPLPANIPSYPMRLAERPRPDVRGPNPPFLFYSIEQWDKLRKENPSVPKSDTTKILEDQWSAMTEEAQAPYEKESDAWNQKFLVRRDL
jgi:hypothetical protein